MRDIRAARAATGRELRESTAVVFQRPLPYLYLAQQVLADARVPFQAFDALPLAAEPYAALLDLVLAMARTGGTREATVALLRSPLLRSTSDGAPSTCATRRRSTRCCRERRATGEADTYPGRGRRLLRRTRDARCASTPRGRRASRARRRVDRRTTCAVSRRRRPPSAQVGAIAAFLRRHERAPDAVRDPRGASAHLRARARRCSACSTALRTRVARHDDGPRPDEDLTRARPPLRSRGRRSRRGAGADGVHLVDAVAARFGEFDHVHLVGLVETDWPERPRRSIFYTSGLLNVARLAAGERSGAGRSRRRFAICSRCRRGRCTFTRFSSRATPSSRCRR